VVSCIGQGRHNLITVEDHPEMEDVLGNMIVSIINPLEVRRLN
jgi:hypothetical protein